MSDFGERHPSEAVHAQAFADSKFGAEAVLRLRGAFARSDHPMLVADDARRWTAGNSAASDLLGISQEEIPWRKMDEFTPLSEHRRLGEQWQAFLETGSAEGWHQLLIPDRGSIAMEFSGMANVLPGRHLTVFVPPDEMHAEGGTLSPQLGWIPVSDDADRSSLTEREREVMSLVAAGLQTNDAAERLFLSPETVKTHVQNALGKLGAHTRAHAVAVALVTGQIAWEA
jgi:DNA-binding CsgD family transcriptional regulator